MERILLIAPLPLRFELTQDENYRNLPFSKIKSFIAPLHLATIAGLTPKEYEVVIWDEAVKGRICDNTLPVNFDLVGLTGYTAHLPRAVELSKMFRSRGIPVAIGGAGISSLPHKHYNDFDILFIGEAEYTWPQFLNDWRQTKYKKVYRQIRPIDLSTTPPPRWDSIKEDIASYLLGGVQTSRGCPFDCDFCDVSYLFGRKFRHKSINQVLVELRALNSIGMNKVVICDDNFAGNPAYTKELLQEIITLNNSFSQPMGFATEASINIANDQKLLELLADANFIEIFIGIESPNKESLKEANKLQNFKSNLIKDIQKIQSYGLAVRGSLIVGFDHDYRDIFDQHFKFVQESCLTIPSIRVLMAPPGTRLWKRVLKEGRLLKTETEGRFYGNPGTTNIIPKNMTRTELLTGYLELIKQVYAWENFAMRIKGFISNVSRKPKAPSAFKYYSRIISFIYFIFLRMDRESRKIVLDIIFHTLKIAPFMLPRITGFIIRQYGYAYRPKLQESIEELINFEKSGKISLEIESNENILPDSFFEFYKNNFPIIQEMVSNRLINKNLEEEVIIKIFSKYFEFQTKYEFINYVNSKEKLQNISNDIIEEFKTIKDNYVSKNYIHNKTEISNFGIEDSLFKAIEQQILISKSENHQNN
jgi:radical SAM superfamily enzyme YgiQ (UPF0313 family)